MPNYADQLWVDLIKKDWFSNNIIGLNEDGENKIINGKFHIGLYVGAFGDIYNVFHEMGHLIEIDNKRCSYPGWNLSYGKPWYIMGKSGFEMYTNKAIEREIRVFGIQLHLHHFYDHEHVLNRRDTDDYIDDAHYMAKTCKWIQGYWLYHSKKIKNYQENEQHAALVIREKIFSEYKKWTIDSIREAWNNKLRVLKSRGELSSYGTPLRYIRKSERHKYISDYN